MQGRSRSQCGVPASRLTVGSDACAGRATMARASSASQQGPGVPAPKGEPDSGVAVMSMRPTATWTGSGILRYYRSSTDWYSAAAGIAPPQPKSPESGASGRNTRPKQHWDSFSNHKRIPDFIKRHNYKDFMLDLKGGSAASALQPQLQRSNPDPTASSVSFQVDSASRGSNVCMMSSKITIFAL